MITSSLSSCIMNLVHDCFHRKGGYIYMYWWVLLWLIVRALEGKTEQEFGVSFLYRSCLYHLLRKVFCTQSHTLSYRAFSSRLADRKQISTLPLCLYYCDFHIASHYESCKLFGPVTDNLVPRVLIPNLISYRRTEDLGIWQSSNWSVMYFYLIS